ncbi:thymidine kinase, cytosolic-like [Tigriopus californicus]|uniref:thymidine kinase, cytosolic-like n=1 Tax=Tigriopus californicus TaxID=6832 RepID=UPI0027DA8B06|nr:thymidine kinase, cytosolic-like [Tigriopus californicus]
MACISPKCVSRPLRTGGVGGPSALPEANQASTHRSGGGGGGQIQVIFGPMFSGKSTELIRRLKRYQIARYECLIVKYAKDVRYDSESIATHDRQTLKAVSATCLSDLRNQARKYDVIGIDEGQFFPDVVAFCEDMANCGLTVIVAALDGTFQRKGFSNILELVPLAEHVVKLTAVCMSCFGEGSYTKRISADTAVEVIGGAETYMAVCRKCFQSPVNVPSSPRMPLGENASSPVSPTEREVKKSLFCNPIDQGDKENMQIA